MQPERRIVAALKIQHMRRNFFLGIGNDDAPACLYGFSRALEFRKIIFRLRMIPSLKSVNTNHEVSRSLSFFGAALSTDLAECGACGALEKFKAAAAARRRPNRQYIRGRLDLAKKCLAGANLAKRPGKNQPKTFKLLADILPLLWS